MLRIRPFSILLISVLTVLGAPNTGAVMGLPSAMAGTGDIDTRPTMMRSIHTVKTNMGTFVDFDLSGQTYATIASSGRHVNITFANTRPAIDLAQHVVIDNALGQMSINGQTEGAGAVGSMTTVSLELANGMNAALEQAPEGDGVRLSLTPIDTAPSTVVSMVDNSFETRDSSEKSVPKLSQSPVTGDGPHLYDLDAYNSDAASLFKSLASQSKTNIVMIGNVENKVTIHFAQTTIDRAIDLLAKAAGLSYMKDDGSYIVGSDKDLATAYPNQSTRYQTSQRVYHCNYVDAGSLATSLIGAYDKTLLHVSIGALERTTALSGSGAQQGVDSGGGSGGYGGASSPSDGGASTPSTPGGGGGGSASSSSSTTGRESREVILSGNADVVDQAYSLATTLDRRRKQVKIDVSISDVSLDDLKNLGIQWTFPQVGIHEGTPNGLRFGGFTRDPLSFDATMSALEDKNKAKLLAAPSISLLDGEQGYILIGQRVSYPILTGYTQAQTPIFTVGQEQVGIYLQVKAQMTGDDEIMLSVYPQVSFITGYLNVNGASYPQVSTREQQTTIRIHSGGKVVIGGLINDEDIKDNQNVPILSKIPLFGELFKYRNTHKTRDEVIVTITPQVLAD